MKNSKPILCWVLSGLDRSQALEQTILGLYGMKHWQICVVFLHHTPPAMMHFLETAGVDCSYLSLQGKRSYPRILLQLAVKWYRSKPTIVHCHLFDACLIGLTVAWLFRVPQRVYTRHHSTLHHVYFPRAVWYDRYLNWLASHIVAISEVVERVLIERESLDPRKCRRIPHGFEERLFSKIDTERIEKLKHKYALHNAYPVVGVVARFTKWKGIQYIIPAFRQLVTMYPRAHLLMANAKGDFSKELHRELSTLPKGSFTTIDFEADMPALYKCMDVYVHTPIDTTSEAFGQTYIEAALAGVPLVCTISGIANEWVVHETHALVVPYQQVEPITSALYKILTGPQETQSRIEAAVSAARHYSLDQHLLNLAALYQESEH